MVWDKTVGRGLWVGRSTLTSRAAAPQVVPAARTQLSFDSSLGVALSVFVRHWLVFLSRPFSAVSFITLFFIIQIRLVIPLFGNPRGYPLEWHIPGDGRCLKAGWASQAVADSPVFHRDRPL